MDNEEHQTNTEEILLPEVQWDLAQKELAQAQLELEWAETGLGRLEVELSQAEAQLALVEEELSISAADLGSTEPMGGEPPAYIELIAIDDDLALLEIILAENPGEVEA